MPVKQSAWVRSCVGLSGVIAAGLITSPLAAQDFSSVEITTVAIADGISMLVGEGGNIGVSTGEDGTFLIDDQYAPLTDKILAAVSEITDQPVQFVLNTHWHSDHTGGNENLGNAGATIVAHDNVRERMAVVNVITAFDAEIPAAPKAALPALTFNDTVTFHLNGQTILDLAGESTQIVPGHGPLSTPAELAAYRDMLVTVQERTQEAIAAGTSLEEFVTSDPITDIDAEWGGGFLKADQFLTIVYRDLSS